MPEILNNNDKKTIDEANNYIFIVTDDNLVHNFFNYFEVYFDCGDCLSNVILQLPKMEVESSKYWVNYRGDVLVYMDSKKNAKQTNKETYYDLNGLKPFFKGKVSRVVETQETLDIYIDSIGRRFKQKIPDDFREQYIYNQNVRDAFQAICEFLGVKYICPPPIKDETQVNNDVDQTLQTEQDIANQKDKAKERTIQNGYSNVNFDANGSIVCGETVIEESPDMAKILIKSEKDPISLYEEESRQILSDIKKILNGGMFDELHGDVLDYDAITVEPRSSGSSEMEQLGGGSVSLSNNSSFSTQANSSSFSTQTNSNFSSKAINRITWLVNRYYSYYPDNQKSEMITRLSGADKKWEAIAKITNTYMEPKDNTQDGFIRLILQAKNL